MARVKYVCREAGTTYPRATWADYYQQQRAQQNHQVVVKEEVEDIQEKEEEHEVAQKSDYSIRDATMLKREVKQEEIEEEAKPTHPVSRMITEHSYNLRSKSNNVKPHRQIDVNNERRETKHSRKIETGRQSTGKVGARNRCIKKEAPIIKKPHSSDSGRKPRQPINRSQVNRSIKKQTTQPKHSYFLRSSSRVNCPLLSSQPATLSVKDKPTHQYKLRSTARK